LAPWPIRAIVFLVCLFCPWSRPCVWRTHVIPTPDFSAFRGAADNRGSPPGFRLLRDCSSERRFGGGPLPGAPDSSDFSVAFPCIYSSLGMGRSQGGCPCAPAVGDRGCSDLSACLHERQGRPRRRTIPGQEIRGGGRMGDPYGKIGEAQGFARQRVFIPEKKERPRGSRHSSCGGCLSHLHPWRLRESGDGIIFCTVGFLR